MLSKTEADDILVFFYHFKENVRLGISYESYAKHEMSRLRFSEKKKKYHKNLNVVCFGDNEDYLE